MSGSKIENYQIEYKTLRGGEWEQVPQLQFTGDAGIDLCASRSVQVYPKAFAQIPTNMAIALPHGVWGLLVGRSSTFYKRLLLANTGIIDSGYRGEVMALVYNLGRKRALISAGDRLIQLILMSNITGQYHWSIAMELAASERGEKGFGSTGGSGERGGQP